MSVEQLDLGILVGAAVLVAAVAAVRLSVGTGTPSLLLGAARLRVVALPSSGPYPVGVLAVCGLAHGVATQVRASGFLAVDLAALVLGNAELGHGPAVRGFAEGLGWLAQIGLFVLLVTPSRVPAQVVPALLVGAVLLLVARPLSVVAAVGWSGVPLREQVLLSWGGLRGAVPIVLATVPAVEGVPGSRGLVELVLVVVVVLVVVFTLVQAPTLPALARRLGLDREQSRALEVETSPLGVLGAEVLQVRVGPASLLHGLEVFELRLPAGADVGLVVRDGRTIVPEERTALRHGDDLLVVAEVRAATGDRLQALSAGGRPAAWRAGGAPAAPAAPAVPRGTGRVGAGLRRLGRAVRR